MTPNSCCPFRPPYPVHHLPWQRSPGLLAWPHDWQRPARTEEWAFEEGTAQLGQSPFTELICFPWATLVDLLDRDHLDRARPFVEALDLAPPRTTLIRATVCQHIRVEPILPWLKALQITDIFWSHACTDKFELNGIRVHPFPLYPVRARYRGARAGKRVERRGVSTCSNAYSRAALVLRCRLGYEPAWKRLALPSSTSGPMRSSTRPV